MRTIFYAAAVLGCTTAATHAASVFVETNYRSAADIPSGFYNGGNPLFLENFEDGSLDGGITASSGLVTFAGSGDTDSVDGDDGAIDGSGTGGRAYYAPGLPGITFTFSALYTAVGIVWTDGGFSFGGLYSGTTVKAFDNDGNEVASTTGDTADTSFLGTTAEDTFYGFTHAGGIRSIFISHEPLGMEVDHIQYGNMVPTSLPSAVPLPAGLPLLVGALGGFALLRRRLRG